MMVDCGPGALEFEERGRIVSETIPEIDISPLRGPGGGKAAAVDAIAEACGRWGFFQAVGDGIPAGLMGRVWRQARQFFALPHEEKLAISRTKENPHGYYDRELTKNARDLKEVFDYGSVPHPELPADHPENRLAVDGHNRWPASLPEFQPTMIEHYRACEALAFTLMEAFCLGLGAPRDRLARHFEGGHASFARLNHYPLDDPLEEEHAAGAASLGDLALHHHTDAGLLTVLMQDREGGLQILAGDEWIDIEPIDGALVVNVGDMMQVWSNDRYRSALHRVLHREKRERYSVPFFFNPSYDADCAPLDELTRDEGPHYRPVNWGTFRQLRTDGDYADLGPEVQLDDYRL